MDGPPIANDPDVRYLGALLGDVIRAEDPALFGRIERIRATGRHVAFVTNNASRTPAKVAEKLVGVGVQAAASDVVTSAQAAARVLAEEHGAGAKILLLGGEGLRVALLEADLAGLPPTVVVTAGHDPLRDEAEQYVERLRTAGVPVAHRRWEGMVHGFHAMGRFTPCADEALDWAVGALSGHLRG